MIKPLPDHETGKYPHKVKSTPLMKRIHTHYDNLKVARNAPPEVIRASYKSLSQKYHPDRNPNDLKAAKIMALINQAYDALSDPGRRAKHDCWIKEQEEGQTDSDHSDRLFVGSNQQNSRFPPLAAGMCRFTDLPEKTRKRIMERISGKETNQFRLELKGIGWNYFWVTILPCWFGVLFDSSAFKWTADTNNSYIFFTIFIAMFIAINVARIYSWHKSPLRSLLIVSPLYVIKTHFDKLWYWPIPTISDIRATHNYRNSSYQETSLAIYFNGKPETFSLPSTSAYQSFTNILNGFNNKFRAAVTQNNIDYLVRNDDLLSYRLSPLPPGKPDNIKKNVLIYAAVLSVASILYALAYHINQGHPAQPALPDWANHHPAPSSAPAKTTRNLSPIVEPSEQHQPYRQAPAYTPEQPDEPPAYVRPATAPNGKPWPAHSGYVSGFKKLHTDGRCKVTIDNSQNDSDVFVKLVSINKGKAYPARVFFIDAHGQFTLDKVRPGHYDIRYRELDSGALSRTEPFDLQEIRTDEGVRYSIFTMTLYKIIGGNMQMYGISESEF
jgi:hypothetical protein